MTPHPAHATRSHELPRLLRHVGDGEASVSAPSGLLFRPREPIDPDLLLEELEPPTSVEGSAMTPPYDPDDTAPGASTIGPRLNVVEKITAKLEVRTEAVEKSAHKANNLAQRVLGENGELRVKSEALELLHSRQERDLLYRLETVEREIVTRIETIAREQGVRLDRHRERLDENDQRFARDVKDMGERLDRHEARIAKLAAWRTWTTGVCAAVVAVGAVLWAIVTFVAPMLQGFLAGPGP